MTGKPTLIYTGKVRDVYNIGYGLLAINHSDRLSAFDNYVCDIENKGLYLTKMSEYWFNKTKHIIPNHCLFVHGGCMICKRCKSIKIEVVVRGYITGSMWRAYEKDERLFCGVELPDGLVKGQRLDHPIITPTTKGDIDEPISAEEIVKQGVVTQEQWDYISEKALELFEFGQYTVMRKGLVLVDTKYEFGFDINAGGRIILIDEIHTCDSSRYWIYDKEAEVLGYYSNPKTIDKDIMRDFIKSYGHPTNGGIVCDAKFEEIKQQTHDAYLTFCSKITDSSPNDILKEHIYILELVIDMYFENCDKVIICAGSIRDEEWVEKLSLELEKFNIVSTKHFMSAHKQPRELVDFIDEVNKKENKIIWVAVAGMTNALGGVLGHNSKYPVINCPPFKDKTDMMVNINSSLQNPSDVPVATMLSPGNVALYIAKTFTTFA
jgi:fusion protein PurCD